ncbi:hypothetical protein PQR05_37110 [Paraburkholderia sediminicola]|uniref:hypothetical protein n=1 Tax=Paraburkholderia sediminicola TaxID=458836 RepID=UPI0038B6B672
MLLQVSPARVQPASHHRWQCKVIFYPVMVKIALMVAAFAFRLLCMGALYTNYSSSHVFGTEHDSPNALRFYAEGLLRKASELDGALLPEGTCVDWVNRLRGEGQAFTCTAVLYNAQSEHLKTILKDEAGSGPLHQVRDEMIPLAWRTG